MRLDHEGLKSAVDDLPDGPEKAEALAALAELRQLDSEGRPNDTRASDPGSMVNRIGCFIFFCAIAGFFIVSLYRGQFPNPFLALFLGVFALIFLGIALGFESRRIEIKFRRTSAFTRRMRARQKELAEKNSHED